MSQEQAIDFGDVIDALKTATTATREMVASRSDADEAARKAIELSLIHI